VPPFIIPSGLRLARAAPSPTATPAAATPQIQVGTQVMWLAAGSVVVAMALWVVAAELPQVAATTQQAVVTQPLADPLQKIPSMLGKWSMRWVLAPTLATRLKIRACGRPVGDSRSSHRPSSMA